MKSCSSEWTRISILVVIGLTVGVFNYLTEFSFVYNYNNAILYDKSDDGFEVKLIDSFVTKRGVNNELMEIFFSFGYIQKLNEIYFKKKIKFVLLLNNVTLCNGCTQIETEKEMLHFNELFNITLQLSHFVCNEMEIRKCFKSAAELNKSEIMIEWWYPKKSQYHLYYQDVINNNNYINIINTNTAFYVYQNLAKWSLVRNLCLLTNCKWMEDDYKLASFNFPLSVRTYISKFLQHYDDLNACLTLHIRGSYDWRRVNFRKRPLQKIFNWKGSELMEELDVHGYVQDILNAYDLYQFNQCYTNNIYVATNYIYHITDKQIYYNLTSYLQQKHSLNLVLLNVDQNELIYPEIKQFKLYYLWIEWYLASLGNCFIGNGHSTTTQNIILFRKYSKCHFFWNNYKNINESYTAKRNRYLSYKTLFYSLIISISTFFYLIIITSIFCIFNRCQFKYMYKCKWCFLILTGLYFIGLIAFIHQMKANRMIIYKLSHILIEYVRSLYYVL